MALCHECGSEVAENDVFCPFCGISLKPIEIDDGELDPAFESTIVMSTPPDVVDVRVKQPLKSETGEVPDIKAVIGTEDVTLEDIPVAPEDTKSNENVPQVSAGPTDHDIAIPESASSVETHTASDEPDNEIYDVPVPAVLTELENTAGQLFHGINDRKPESPVNIETHDEPAGIERDETEAYTRDPETEFTSAAMKPETEAQSDNVQEEILSVDTPDKPSPFEGLPAVEAVNDASSPSHGEISSREVGDEPAEEQGISKPVDVPVPEDQYATPSRFDSVRIMETPDSEPNQSESNSAVSETSETGSTKSQLGSGSIGEGRPQTASNIGMVDTDGRRSAKLKPLEEGTLLNNRYEIVRKIGGGGMGAVYLSSDNNLGGVLRAVKEMVQAHIEEAQQEKAILDFKRESMILSTLDHPSIPTIYDYFFDDIESRFYLVMKYISGGDLSARLRSAPEGKLDEITVTEWGIQIADVLDYLHSQPTTIVYRDLKPSNIMIDGNSGRVMLIDFGIARSINQKEEKGVTAVGTMGYAPPELFSGNVEPRSDIYSLGSTMFHLLTGADPQSNPLLIFDFQKNPRPRQINPQLSDQIERFLMKSVEYNAASRFGSAYEVRHVLEEHLDSLRKGNVTYGVNEIPASISLANQSVFCGFCGQKIVATDLFCAFCGAKQPLAQQGVHSEIYTPAPMTAKLFVIGTSDLESPTFQLEKPENLIGRRDPMSNIFPEVDLSKYDPQTKISRRHAKIWRDGTNYVLEDLASSNGTIILPSASDSRRLMPHQPYTLANGDKIKLGDTTLHFIVG
jgi:serine/threonine protein kinase